nr:hypothetical protein GCM10020093_008590 [Planobispora longispora]
MGQPVVGPALLGVHQPGVEPGGGVDVQVLDEQARHGAAFGTASHAMARLSRTVTSPGRPPTAGRRGRRRVEAGVAVLPVVQDPGALGEGDRLGGTPLGACT